MSQPVPMLTAARAQQAGWTACTIRALNPRFHAHPLPLFPDCSYNKQVLKVFPYPITITALQFLVGSLIASTMWLLRLHKRPEGSFVENVSAGLSGGGAGMHHCARRVESLRGAGGGGSGSLEGQEQQQGAAVRLHHCL